MTQTQPQTEMSKKYAWNLYVTAQEFYQTYVVVEQSHSKMHDFLAMRHFLLCHALEVTLKSLLIDTGVYNEKMLKDRKLGHDLEALAHEVKQVYGQFPEVDACMGFIPVLNPDYKSKGYEYPINSGRFTGTQYDKVAVLVETLIHTTAKSIRSNKYPDQLLP